MPAISEIPGASALQMQLASVNNAIVALGSAGTTLTNIVVAPAPDQQNPGLFTPPIGLTLDPAISDPTTLHQLQTALQAQADQITQKLVSMGFSDDTGAVVAQGPAPVVERETAA